MRNRDEFNQKNNSELADILKRTRLGDKCKYCAYTSGDCFRKSCLIGIEMWLSASCANEPENPPVDKHVDLQRVSARKIKELADRGVITMAKCKPEVGEEYYIPEIIDGKPDMFTTEWNDDDLDHKRYEAGVVFTDKYDAIIVAKKMLDMVKEIADEKREL